MTILHFSWAQKTVWLRGSPTILCSRKGFPQRTFLPSNLGNTLSTLSHNFPEEISIVRDSLIYLWQGQGHTFPLLPEPSEMPDADLPLPVFYLKNDEVTLELFVPLQRARPRDKHFLLTSLAKVSLNFENSPTFNLSTLPHKNLRQNPQCSEMDFHISLLL